MKIARIYERVSTSEQDLTRQADIEKTAIASGFYTVQDEDVEKLSPLQCGHINMQGRYSFTVPESVSKGELRAFNEEV